MGGLEDRQRLFTGHGAAPLVGVCDEHPKSSLAEATARQVLRSETRLLLRTCGECWFRRAAPGHPNPHRFPECTPVGRFRIVGLSLNDVGRPAGGHGKPLGLVEEEGLSKYAAADHRVE